MLNQPPILLSQATTDGDLHVGPAVLGRLQLSEVAVELVVGVLPDAAGVEHDDVSIVQVGGRHHAVSLEEAGQLFGIVLVHLASESADQIAARLGHKRLG